MSVNRVDDGRIRRDSRDTTLSGVECVMYLVWATCACTTAKFSGSTWNKKIS